MASLSESLSESLRVSLRASHLHQAALDRLLQRHALAGRRVHVAAGVGVDDAATHRLVARQPVAGHRVRDGRHAVRRATADARPHVHDAARHEVVGVDGRRRELDDYEVALHRLGDRHAGAGARVRVEAVRAADDALRDRVVDADERAVARVHDADDREGARLADRLRRRDVAVD